MMLLAAPAYLVMKNVVWLNSSPDLTRPSNSEHHQAKRAPLDRMVPVPEVIGAEPSSETLLQLSIVLADEVQQPFLRGC
jgi:hypothetical protein